MATRPEDASGSRLWRGMRTLLFGDEGDNTLRAEIEAAIDEADAEPPVAGDLSALERQMLRNLLHFGDRTAGDISVPRGEIVAVPASASFTELVRAFADAEHSRLPVTGEDGLDDILGMIHIKDVFKAQEKGGCALHDLLRAPLFVPETMGVLDLLARMQSGKVHLAIVVDEFGGTEGLVTIEDVVEEIVGEIDDEHDEVAAVRIEALGEGRWDIDARTELEEVRETVDPAIRAEDDEVDTIGGLAFMTAGRLLGPGESIELPSEWRIECIEAEPRRMVRLRLYAPAAAEA